MGSGIYTRGGDRGTTSLSDGSRVPKDAPRVETYGTLDEANSWVGLALSEIRDPLLRRILIFLQQRLYNCTSRLATPSGAGPALSDEDVVWMERAIDRLEEPAGPLTAFILPGGSRASGLLHVARTVCRRAERRLVSLAATEPVEPLVLKLVNRASDLLFNAARYANTVEGQADVLWDPAATPPAL